ncbi:uncharacterized protein CCR75_001929 [Bremia lactucae]|uniref:Uncharacterized protein n=1 Tax=Bremia lactucae TaxID=4779 RepID=A0A976FQI2_BRELC|nr:hypothetical protein CCR75_001929 [Bremia lactucae]
MGSSGVKHTQVIDTSKESVRKVMKAAGVAGNVKKIRLSSQCQRCAFNQWDLRRWISIIVALLSLGTTGTCRRRFELLTVLAFTIDWKAGILHASKSGE